jgi:hypothetical protein
MIWNRCDDCRRFIAVADFAAGVARRRLVCPDNAFGPEEWETLCRCCVPSRSRNDRENDDKNAVTARQPGMSPP